jgi:hypothetical protein
MLFSTVRNFEFSCGAAHEPWILIASVCDARPGIASCSILRAFAGRFLNKPDSGPLFAYLVTA